jgi:hypothetical protein
MTAQEFKNLEIEYKLKCTFLHNNLEEGRSYNINGNPHKYEGYKATRTHAQAHIFTREGRSTPLILAREEISVLDLFNTIDLKNPKI